jgi:hypothetical protein
MKTKRTDTPATGPRACLRTAHVHGPCSKCGQPMAPAHSPLRLAGLFCGSCCPCCAPVTVAGPEPSPATDGAILGQLGATAKPLATEAQ